MLFLLENEHGVVKSRRYHPKKKKFSLFLLYISIERTLMPNNVTMTNDRISGRPIIKQRHRKRRMYLRRHIKMKNKNRNILLELPCVGIFSSDHNFAICNADTDQGKCAKENKNCHTSTQNNDYKWGKITIIYWKFLKWHYSMQITGKCEFRISSQIEMQKHKTLFDFRW